MSFISVGVILILEGVAMKLGIFTDPHYSSQDITCGNRYNNQSLRKIQEAYDCFTKENCDLVVCLGDLTDTEDTHEKELENLKQIAKIIEKAPMDTICVMGNHDAFAYTAEEFYHILSGCKPQNRTLDDVTLVFLDTCFYKDGTHYMPGGGDWTDTFLPNPAALQNTLDETKNKIYIFLHQNTDLTVRDDHRLFNAEDVSKIIERSGKVRTVFQGHYHPGQTSQHNGVQYITLPAMCEDENRYYIFEL